MSWSGEKLNALVSGNVKAVNDSYELFSSGRTRQKGQEMSDAARAKLQASGVVVEPRISLGIGVPAIDTVPKVELAASMENAILRSEDEVWGYWGAPELSAALAEHFVRVRGDTAATPAHFMADGGSSGAIGSIARAFLAPGDAIISERPGYVGSMDAFTSQPGVRYVGVDLNDDGLDMAELGSVVAELKAQGSTAKMIYIQTLYHNPRGTGYTVARMRELLTFCAEHSILILNDEAYYGLHLDPETEPVYLSAIAAEMGLSLGLITACTFSKTIAPGLRAGYTFAEPVIINQISAVKTGSVSSVLLLGLADFIERGEWDKQITKVQAVCKYTSNFRHYLISAEVGLTDCLRRQTRRSSTRSRPRSTSTARSGSPTSARREGCTSG